MPDTNCAGGFQIQNASGRPPLAQPIAPETHGFICPAELPLLGDTQRRGHKLLALALEGSLPLVLGKLGRNLCHSGNHNSTMRLEVASQGLDVLGGHQLAKVAKNVLRLQRALLMLQQHRAARLANVARSINVQAC